MAGGREGKREWKSPINTSTLLLGQCIGLRINCRQKRKHCQLMRDSDITGIVRTLCQ